MLKKRFFKTKDEIEVAFELALDDAERVELLCESNGWEPIVMKKAKNGAFRTKIRLPKEQRFQFRYLIDGVRSTFGVGPERVLHTAQSLYHDLVPARACGLANAWIDRQRLSEGGGWGATAAVAERPATDFLFFSLGDLAVAAAAELASVPLE